MATHRVETTVATFDAAARRVRPPITRRRRCPLGFAFERVGARCTELWGEGQHRSVRVKTALGRLGANVRHCVGADMRGLNAAHFVAPIASCRVAIVALFVPKALTVSTGASGYRSCAAGGQQHDAARHVDRHGPM